MMNDTEQSHQDQNKSDNELEEKKKKLQALKNEYLAIKELIEDH